MKPGRRSVYTNEIPSEKQTAEYHRMSGPFLFNNFAYQNGQQLISKGPVRYPEGRYNLTRNLGHVHFRMSKRFQETRSIYEECKTAMLCQIIPWSIRQTDGVTASVGKHDTKLADGCLWRSVVDDLEMKLANGVSMDETSMVIKRMMEGSVFISRRSISS